MKLTAAERYDLMEVLPESLDRPGSKPDRIGIE
jgi:hypothetical protein